MAIQEATKVARMGALVTGTYAEILAKVTGLVGGTGLYALKVGDSVKCGEDTFELRERMQGTQKFQSPSFKLADGRVVSISTIARRDKAGKFHAKSTGMDILENCQSAFEVITALNGKTLTVLEVSTIQLPVYGKDGEEAPAKQYAFSIV